MERRPEPGGIPAPPLPEPDASLYVIHYSQERAEDCVAATPAVSAVVAQNVLTGRQWSFSALQVAEGRGIPLPEWPDRWDELERGMLEGFLSFLAGHPDAIWLHWGMRGPCFGFQVLAQRAHLHGLAPDDDLPGREFDLANYLKRTYGRDFAPHPRLWHASHQNDAAGPGMLSEEQAVAAWAAGHHAVLLRSLCSKVHAITRLYELARARRFRTAGLVTPPVASVDVLVEPLDSSDELMQLPMARPPSPTVQEIAAALRRAGRKGNAMPAALVELMEHRDSASTEEVAEMVHRFRGSSCKRIYANVQRTNRELEALSADFRFKVSAGHVHKIAAGASSCPEVDDISPAGSPDVAVA